MVLAVAVVRRTQTSAFDRLEQVRSRSLLSDKEKEAQDQLLQQVCTILLWPRSVEEGRSA